MILSKTQNASLGSLLGAEGAPSVSESGGASNPIRIISPNEGVIISTSKGIRSLPFKGGKSTPKYALYTPDEKGSVPGPQNTFLEILTTLQKSLQRYGTHRKPEQIRIPCNTA